MKETGIKLSPTHGLNASIAICPICKEQHSLILYGELENDAEAPKYTEGELCPKCQKNYIAAYEVDSEHRATGRVAYFLRAMLSDDFKDKEYCVITTEDFEEICKKYT